MRHVEFFFALLIRPLLAILGVGSVVLFAVGHPWWALTTADLFGNLALFVFMGGTNPGPTPILAEPAWHRYQTWAFPLAYFDCAVQSGKLKEINLLLTRKSLASRFVG